MRVKKRINGPGRKLPQQKVLKQLPRYSERPDLKLSLFRETLHILRHKQVYNHTTHDEDVWLREAPKRIKQLELEVKVM